MGKPTRDTQLRLSSAHNADRAAGIPPNHWCYRFFASLYCSFDNAQFAHLYQDGGRAPISPTLLACITILQYAFKVSDRMAVENTVMRRDWRIALGRDDSWAGFDASVLCNFRKRLVEHGCEEMIFGHVLEQMRSLGLLANRRKVRVDATALVANVATLSRADLISETLRVAVCELWDACPELRGHAELARLYDKYGEEVWLGREGSGEGRLTRLGCEGFVLLEFFELVERPRARTLECRDLLARVLEENFERSDGDDDPRPLEGDELGKDRIVTPHEPDVRVGTKKHKSWVGNKVHLVETADTGVPNFVVDVLVTEPTVPDVNVTLKIIDRAREVLPEAEVLLADSGYASAENSEKASEHGMDLVSPPLANTSTKDIFSAERFIIDFATRTATCPARHTTDRWYPGERGIRIRFRKSVCAACPLRSECTTAKDGRSLHISLYYEQLMRDRARAETNDFRKLYRQRAAVEGTISQAVHQCGLRVSRYRGRLKRIFHAWMAGTALNMRRWILPVPCTTGARAGA